MRVIDDYVDDEFLTSNAQTRISLEGFASEKIVKWQANALAASKNEFAGTNSDYPDIFKALNTTLGKSSLGTGPWDRLACAMQADVSEKPLADWDDFLQYCVGATIAPAEVFLYTLCCDVDKHGIYSADTDYDFQDLAHEMAIFCYLVHIMRDIAKDSLQGGQLVTIPTNFLNDVGLTRDNISTSADKLKLEKLVLRLILKTEELLPELNRKEAWLKTKLKRREWLILSTLLSIYRRLFDKIKANPKDFISGDITGLETDRENIAQAHQLLTQGET